ncbi:MAG TPA: hypothetical protein VFB06_32195 [Streptosporangiaceae bacterium]|nr:hypothetical protein [Streptosporangiaceae bacterium]
MGRDFDDTQLIIGDGGAEFSGQTDAPAPLRIGQQMTDLGDRKRWDYQAGPVASEELHAPTMIPVSLVEGSHERAGIAQDHADAAPPTSSRSG